MSFRIDFTARIFALLSVMFFLGAASNASTRFSMADVLSAPFVYELNSATDGRAVAFAAHEGGRRNVYYWDGRSTRQITSYTADDGAALSELTLVPHHHAVVYVRGGTQDEGERSNPNPSALAEPPLRTVWLVEADKGAPQLLGTGQSPTVSPAGDRVVWTNEHAIECALLTTDASGRLRPGKAQTLSTSAGTLRDLAFSPDGSRLAFTNDRADHSFVGDLTIGDLHIVYADAAFTSDSAPAWSPDGKVFAFIRRSAAQALDPFLPDDVANAPWSIVLADAKTGNTRTIFTPPPGRGEAFYPLDQGQQVFWDANGTALIFPWERDGWRHLYSVATTGSAQPTLLTPGEYEVETATPTPDGGALLLASNEADIERRHCWRLELNGSAPKPLTGGPDSQWSPVGLGSSDVAYINAGFDRPPTVMASVDGAAKSVGGPAVPVTFPSASLVEPQLITFRSADGLLVHGQLFAPRDAKAKHPALIFTHGGPMRQMLPGFHYFEAYTNLYESNQYLANHGFVVLSINYRSGIMYGHDFRAAKQIGYLGAAEYRDVLAGAALLRARPDVDGERMGLYGLSYGGLLTALGLARNSDVFRAGVDYAGVFDWVSLLDPDGKGLGTPTERAIALAASPVAAIQTWRSPVFLSQGDDDRNVAFGQGLDLARRLHERGIAFEELVFPNETHENQVHEHTLHLYTLAAQFLERELGAKPDAEAAMNERALVRAVGLRAAVALNTLAMIGVGPLITIPLVLGYLHGPLSIAGWLLGALLAVCDGLVWSELGALYPGSGGTYGYLRSVFGKTRAGSLLGFVFAWQTLFAAPLNQAVGYIGVANYTGYVFPAVAHSPWAIKGLAIAFGILTLAALYRGITTIARVGLALAGAVIVTLLCVIVAAYTHFTPSLVTALPPHDTIWDGLRLGLGQGLLIAIYDYLGYNQASCIGDEVLEPSRTLPRSIVISVGIVAVIYLVMQVGILGAIPWASIVPHADGSLPPLGQHLASAIVERSFGGPAATMVTLLIVVSAFASMFANLLGYSRIPYAAAVDGQFLPAFAHLNAEHRFPDVSLLVIGLLALPACLLSLDAVFNALTTGMIIIQSIAQIVALCVIRSRGIRSPYRMWLFPLPALIALLGWTFVFVSAGTGAIVFGFVTLAVGTAVFIARAFRIHEWPFATVTGRRPADGDA